jgi:hypothetical protein
MRLLHPVFYRRQIKNLMLITTIICIEDVKCFGHNVSETDDDRFRSKHVVKH